MSTDNSIAAMASPDKLPASPEIINAILADRCLYRKKPVEIAEKYGISEKTYYRWLSHPEVLRLRVALGNEAVKSKLIAQSDDIALSILDSMDAATIQDMSGLQRVTSFGILVDKARQLRGEAAVVIEHRLDPDQVKLRKAEIVLEMQKRGLI